MNRILTFSLVPLLGTLALSAGCKPHLYAPDAAAVMERSAYSYYGECSSWLWSSRSGVRYCASPAFVAKIDAPAAAPAGPRFDESKTDKASMMAAGEKVYGEICAACHQADGMGQPGVYPPLAGAGEFYGEPRKQAGIVVKGLNGPITVKGQSFNGAMPAQGHLSDYEIAAVTTFVRHSWGNDDGVVMPADVAAAR